MSVSINDDSRARTNRRRKRIGGSKFEASSDEKTRPQSDRANLAEDITREVFGEAHAKKNWRGGL